jgi:hypothetical protein
MPASGLKEGHYDQALPCMRIHRWTVIGAANPKIARSGKQRDRWLCQCACGIEKLVLGQNLRLALSSDTGRSRSCGCLALDASLRHGHNRCQQPTSEYMAWLGAKKRCGNSNNPSFRHYGARGVRMCARWRNSFKLFFQDMGPKPDPSFTLDRIDPNGDYEPGNCRWAPIEVQNRNRNGIRWYEFEGQAALLGDIAAFLGISRDQARAFERDGILPARRLLNPPVVPDRISPLVTYVDVDLELDLARELNVGKRRKKYIV